MENRPELQALLEEILGSRNVYFQPPPTVQMKYPAIVYSRSKISNRHANNNVYVQNTMYQIIVIDSDPDSETVEKISMLPYCTHEKNYKTDNLNHDSFTIYY